MSQIKGRERERGKEEREKGGETEWRDSGTHRQWGKFVNRVGGCIKEKLFSQNTLFSILYLFGAPFFNLFSLGDLKLNLPLK